MTLLNPETGEAIDPCRFHGPCEPWCSESDLKEVRNGQCDTGSCLALIEQLNQESAQIGPEGEVLAEGTAGSELFADMAAVATSLLYRLSGEIFRGVCCSQVYFCDRMVCCGWMQNGKGSRDHNGVYSSAPNKPEYVYDSRAGKWTNQWGPDCAKTADVCDLGDRLPLPYSPVCDIKRITVPATWDGIEPLFVLDPASGLPVLDDDGNPAPLLNANGEAYEPGDVYPEIIPTCDVRIVDGCWLVRCDGECWPCPPPDACQDPPALCVEYSHGYGPPPEAILAACTLACELVKSCVTGQCRLPERITMTSFQGMSTASVDNMAFLSEGLTGIYIIDLFLKTWNPHGHQQPPQVLFPNVNGSYCGDRRTFTLRKP